jgi:nucleotide-binding universal stress UspA family protein
MKKIANILVAVDFSKYSINTLTYGAVLARALAAKILIVNVINQKDLDTITRLQAQGFGLSLGQYLADQEKSRSAEADQLIRQAGCQDLEIKKLIRKGVPWVEILEAAREQKADLIIMGALGRTNLPETLFGTTADKVVRRSPIPVLSVKGENQ